MAGKSEGIKRLLPKHLKKGDLVHTRISEVVFPVNSLAGKSLSSRIALKVEKVKQKNDILHAGIIHIVQCDYGLLILPGYRIIEVTQAPKVKPFPVAHIMERGTVVNGATID